jgi:hypothetical protein
VRPTIRLRLTLVHTLLFFLTAVLLVVGIYLLTARSTPPQSTAPRSRVERSLALPPGTLSGRRGSSSDRPSDRPLPVLFPRSVTLPEVASGVQAETRAQLLTKLVVFSASLLIAVTLASFGLGWVTAGRSLRPLRRITERAKSLSETNLHERIGLRDPVTS